MKYYLIIGYQLVEKYKNFPTVRIHVNGQLVDEFDCDNEQATEISSQTRMLKSISKKPGKQFINQLETVTYTIPSKCRIIELDSSKWVDHGKLVLSVSNNNSNYNNGFMTKGSQVWFTPVLLVRKDIYDHESILYSIIEKFNHVRNNCRKTKIDHSKWESTVRHKWPGFNTYRDRRSANTQSVDLFRGGNFEIKFDIIKKHKTYMLVEDNVPSIGYFYIDRFFEAWYQHYRKNHFEIVADDRIDQDTGICTVNTYLKEKSKQINTRDEDQ
jgi:hypothetical protein